MRSRDVNIGPRARGDIAHIADWIAHFVSPLNGDEFLDRLFNFIWRLDLAAQRGIDRADIHPGLRVVPFERRASLAIVINDDAVTVVRVFHRGQDWETALRHQFGRIKQP